MVYKTTSSIIKPSEQVKSPYEVAFFMGLTCHKCGSEELTPTKIINWTPKTDLTFHFRTQCRDCGAYRFRPREEMPREVLDKKWEFSNVTKKRIASGLVSAKFLLDTLEKMGMEVDYEVVAPIPLFFREVDGATQKPTTA